MSVFDYSFGVDYCWDLGVLGVFNTKYPKVEESCCFSSFVFLTYGEDSAWLKL